MSVTFHLRLPGLRLLRMTFLACIALGFASHAGAETRPRAVVEMFTSQGCSTCPPADALLAELAGEPGIIALTMPVDYWDYLGWRDTFARRSFTRRQRRYAEARGDRKLYTPQAVINGMRHAVGSDEAEIRDAVTATRPGMRCLFTDATVERSGDGLAVRVERAALPPGGEADILLVVFDRQVEVQVKSGENHGRALVYHNVVRRMVRLASWQGELFSVTLPDVSVEAHQGAAVLVQSMENGKPAEMIAASMLAE